MIWRIKQTLAEAERKAKLYEEAMNMLCCYYDDGTSKGEEDMPMKFPWDCGIMPGMLYTEDEKAKLPDIFPHLCAKPVDEFQSRHMVIPRIKDYKIYNNKVLVVWFIDGSFTKAVAEDGDAFDFYTGLTICLFKRAIGENGHKEFNNMMRRAIKRTEEIDKEKLEKIEAAAKKKEKRQKAEKKRQEKEEQATEWAIDIHAQAYAKAIRELGMNKCACDTKEDDLK